MERQGQRLPVPFGKRAATVLGGSNSRAIVTGGKSAHDARSEPLDRVRPIGGGIVRRADTTRQEAADPRQDIL